VDIFERCKKFASSSDFAQTLGYPTNPGMAQALGLYPYFIPIDRPEGTEVTIDRRRYIMLGSNNYLGLTSHPLVKEAATAAIRQYGTGCTGSRFMNGTLEIHIELENRLARYVGKQKALIFATGYQANLGAISGLAIKGDIIIADKEAHASILDGMQMAKALKGAETRFFRHNDAQSLEELLGFYPEDVPKIVIVDGVFSMGGDIAPLPAIIERCRKYHARLMVDDAHGLGVLGGGRGTSFHYGCAEEVDLIMGTFSKSFASQGGFIAGRADVIQWIQHFARPFMFSASLSPANVAAVSAALDVIEAEPERVRRVNEIAATMRAELRSIGYDTGNSQTPIVPINIGDPFKTLKVWRMLYKRGLYTNAALPPAVSPRHALLRTSYMATHTDEQLQKVLEGFTAVWKETQNRHVHAEGAGTSLDGPMTS
jgi:8-amino-7-oxononanoate synthase